MPNQRDVALLAGVSSASVSRFLSNPDSVSPEARERISGAIEQLNYKLDYHAQRLKIGRSNHVAILSPGSGPFYWQIFFYIQKSLTAHGYFVSLMFTRDIDPELASDIDHIHTVLGNKLLEGVIFFPTESETDAQIMQALERQHENVVVVDSRIGEGMFPQVLVDNRAAGCQAAQEFLRRGHRDFLVVHGIAEFHSARERLNGFRDELKNHGVKLGLERVIPGKFSPEETYQLVRARLSGLPDFTAVFAESDSMAMGFMRAAAELGLECPRDYSIIGFDNNLEFTPYCRPSLSSFEQRLDVIGKTAAMTLLSLMQNGKPDEPEKGTVLIKPSLVCRESLGTIRQA